MTDYSNPVDNPSLQPLAAIREKERALAQAIRLAQEQAHTRVAEACVRANALQAQAERDGKQEADKLYQDGIASALEQADAIRSAGESAAIQLRETGSTRIAEAAEHIVQFMLPSIEEH